MHKKNQGFSLIELIVILIITAFLSQIGFTAFNRYVRRTRAFAAKTALQNIKKECESNSDLQSTEEYTALAPAGYLILSRSKKKFFIVSFEGKSLEEIGKL